MNFPQEPGEVTVTETCQGTVYVVSWDLAESVGLVPAVAGALARGTEECGWTGEVEAWGFYPDYEWTCPRCGSANEGSME